MRSTKMYARLRCGGDLPLPRPGVDRPLGGNCHPLSSTPDNQVRCVFGSAPYQKQSSTVRNEHSVFKKASWGTRRIFRGIRCKKQAFPVRKGHSVRKTDSCGTRASSVRGTASSRRRANIKRGCIPWKSLRIHPHFLNVLCPGPDSNRHIFKG